MNHPFSPLILLAGIFAIVAIAALNAWTSHINQFFFFARTLPSTFRETPAAKSITRRYLRMIWIAAGLSILVLSCLYAMKARPMAVSLISALLVEAVGVSAAFAIAHRLAGWAFKTFQQSSESGLNALPSTVEDRAISVPLLSTSRQATVRAIVAPVLAAASLWLGGIATSNYSLTTFTNAAGQQGGALLLGQAFGMLFGGTGMRLMLRYSARQRTPLGHYSTRISALFAWAAVSIVFFVVLATRMHYAIGKTVTHIVMTAIVLLASAHVLYLWSSKTLTPSPAEQNGDQHWRAGLFYFNRQDPALFVQRRSGPGYTLNFGNLLSWPLAAFFVADFAFIFLSRHHL